VPNRQQQTILQIFNRFIEKGSILVTDRYPSYVGSLQDFESDHIIVTIQKVLETKKDSLQIKSRIFGRT
jgi:hypothetical protein